MSDYPKLEISLKVVATAIAVFGVFTYFLDQSQTRAASEKSRSLAFVEKFASVDVVEARSRLLAYWREYPEFVSYSRANRLSSREYANFVRATYPAHDDRVDVDEALFRMQVFFDELSYCHFSGICDKGIIESYFCEYTIKFSNVYGTFYRLLAEEIGSKPLDQEVDRLSAHCAQIEKI